MKTCILCCTSYLENFRNSRLSGWNILNAADVLKYWIWKTLARALEFLKKTEKKTKYINKNQTSKKNLFQKLTYIRRFFLKGFRFSLFIWSGNATFLLLFETTETLIIVKQLYIMTLDVWHCLTHKWLIHQICGVNGTETFWQ